MKLFVLLLALCSGCAPLSYVKKSPIKPPDPIEAPSLSTPAWVGGVDCGRFTISGGDWSSEPWSQLGGEIDTIEIGDIHPTVDEANGMVNCRHVVISPGVWVVSREARDRYPMMRQQLTLWQDYSERAATRNQEESEAIAEMVKLARQRQVQTFFVGSGVGAGVVTVVILSIVLAGR